MTGIHYLSDRFWQEYEAITDLEIRWDRARQDAIERFFSFIDDGIGINSKDCALIARGTARPHIDLSSEFETGTGDYVEGEGILQANTHMLMSMMLQHEDSRRRNIIIPLEDLMLDREIERETGRLS